MRPAPIICIADNMPKMFGTTPADSFFCGGEEKKGEERRREEERRGEERRGEKKRGDSIVTHIFFTIFGNYKSIQATLWPERVQEKTLRVPN
jgi:hypothetical protein